MVIRPATEADAPAIAAIQAGSAEASQWTPETCVVAECDSQVAGFVATRAVAADEFEILNLAVAPEFRRRGVALALLSHVMERGDGTWFLEVRESNGAARALYRKAGFQEVGKRQNYYSEPAGNAIVMRIRS